MDIKLKYSLIAIFLIVINAYSSWTIEVNDYRQNNQKYTPEKSKLVIPMSKNDWKCELSEEIEHVVKKTDLGKED